MRRRGLKAGVLVLEEGYMTCSLGSFRGGIVELLFLFFLFLIQVNRRWRRGESRRRREG